MSLVCCLMYNFAGVMQIQDFLKQGLVAGTLIMIIEYVQKVSYYQNSVPYDHNTSIMMWSYLAILILAAVCYRAVVSARSEAGGSIRFGQAFFVSIYVAFVASIMVGGFYFLYARYIDPNEGERMVAYWTEKMRDAKNDEKTIEERMKGLRVGYTASSQFLLGMKYLVYGLFISLVVAAFASRKQKLTERPESGK